MKKIFLVLVIFLLVSMTKGQIGIDLTHYSLSTIPELTPAEEELYQSEGAVCLLDRRIYDYRTEDGSFERWECRHQIYKVYQKEQFDQFRIFYLPANEEEDILECMGRFIDKEGKITKLYKDNIQTIEEDGDTYLGLVFDSVPAEGVFDCFYIIRNKSLPESGKNLFYCKNPIKTAEFTIISPAFLQFEVYTYNGLNPAKDSVMEETKRRYVYSTTDNLPVLKNDPVSYLQANYPMVQFVFAYNHSQSRIRVNTLNEYVTNFTSIIEFDKSNQNRVKKFAKGIAIDKKMAPREKIQMIENYVKKEFYFLDFNHSLLSDPKEIFENKMANTLGLTRVFYNLFRHFNIENQVILTTNKTKVAFDPDFNGSNYCQEVLFYFPSIDEYLSPDFMNLRLGIVPSVLAGQQGLFLTPIAVGKDRYFLPEFREIEPLPVSATGDTLRLNIKVDMTKKNISGQLMRVLSGYNATRVQSSWDKMEDTDKEDFISHYSALGTQSMDVEQLTILHATPEDIGVNPLIIEATVSDYDIAKFGTDKIFVEVGKLIGEQSQFKQEGERTLPIDRTYKGHYFREITLTLPEGFVCANCEEISTAIYDEENVATAQAAFVVSAKQEGNVVTIINNEYYSRLHYPIAEYEKYVRVVNASYHFNQAKLIFDKKE